MQSSPACLTAERRPTPPLCIARVQGGSAAPASGVGRASTDEAAGTAAGAFDDLDDLFGTGFEDLSDGEEGGNGKEAEREMHAKV